MTDGDKRSSLSQRKIKYDLKSFRLQVLCVKRYRAFPSSMTLRRNKLECLSLPSTSALINFLATRGIGQAPAVRIKHLTRGKWQEGFDKHTTLQNVIKLFFFVTDIVENCLMFVGKARSLLKIRALERCFICVVTGPTHKHLTRLERLSWVEHYSLLRTLRPSVRNVTIDNTIGLNYSTRLK